MMRKPTWLRWTAVPVLCATLIPALAAAAPDAAGAVTRAQFTRQVVEREPVDAIVALTNESDSILFFTELRGLQGQTVTHRWEYQGRVMAEIDFEVGGPRWRVHSEKSLLPEQTGMWTVMVVTEQGWPLRAEMFKYTDAMSESDVDEPIAASQHE